MGKRSIIRLNMKVNDGTPIIKCKICKAENKFTSKNLYLDKIHNNHPKICETCIEKILCCEFYKYVLPHINSNDFLELNNLEKQFNDDELYEYCMRLLEKYNIIQYSGALISSFNINKNSKILKDYEEYTNYDDSCFLNEVKISENTNKHQLKYKMDCILKRLNNKESEIAACESTSINILEIQKWINKGKLIYEPYYSFMIEYENLPDYADTYYKNTDIKARKKFLKNLSEGNTAQESANNCGIKPSKIKRWVKKGKKNIKPYDKFYKECREAEKKFYEIKDYEQNKIKNDIIHLISEGYTIIDAIEMLNLRRYSKDIKNYYKLGKQGNEKHSIFYKNCLKAQNEYKEKIKELHNLVSNGKTVDESCQILNINQDNIKEEKLNEIYKIQSDHENILTPLPSELADIFTNENKTGIAWVNKSENLWIYSRTMNKKEIKITDENIFKLHEKVIKNNQIWGIIDYYKAKSILNNEKLNNMELIYEQGILSKLPQEIKESYNFDNNKTGFAWVTKIENKWKYSKNINDKTIEIIDENIYKLYEKVLSTNNFWGVINIKMAKNSINESNGHTSDQINENFEKQNNRSVREIMDIILEERKKGKTREECAEIANIPVRKIPHWSHEGRQKNGKDNIYFYKKLTSIENSLKKQESSDIKKYNNSKNVKKRKLFLEYYKNEKDMNKAAELSSVDISLIEKWILNGKQNKNPFKEFYEEFLNVKNYLENLEPPTDMPNNFEILKNENNEFISENISIKYTRLNKKELKIIINGHINKKELFEFMNKLRFFDEDIINININSLKDKFEIFIELDLNINLLEVFKKNLNLNPNTKQNTANLK